MLRGNGDLSRGREAGGGLVRVRQGGEDGVKLGGRGCAWRRGEGLDEFELQGGY